MSTLIVGDKSGQLGNQLILFAHLIAFAKEYGWQLSFTGFYEHRAAFIGPSADKYARFPRPIEKSLKASEAASPKSEQNLYKRANWLCRLLRRTERVTGRLASTITCAGHAPEHDIDLAESRFIEQIGRTPWTILFGWRFRNYDLFKKHEATIRSYLAYAPRHPVDEYLDHLRQTADMLVAVHVRRGDYQNYEGGKFYFPLQTYADWMRRVEQVSPDKNVAFIVLSNEAVNMDAFAGLNVHSAPGGVVDDQYTMSCADLILGPPSTFSRWASFIGRVPLGIVQSSDADFDLNNFSPAQW